MQAAAIAAARIRVSMELLLKTGRPVGRLAGDYRRSEGRPRGRRTLLRSAARCGIRGEAVMPKVRNNDMRGRDAARGSGRPRRVALALQGGGAHGAYTWGVLDRLVEETGLVIEAVSGTSAGAMNGALLVDGWS